MARKKAGTYIKHVYWLTRAEELRLREVMASQNIRMRSARGIVCTPLDEISRISSVAPEVWRETCARQGSWYRQSDKNGLYLVVSSFEIEGFSEKKVAAITATDFQPPRRASEQEKKEMAQDPQFLRQLPEEWSRIPDTEQRIYLRWARRMGSDVDDYASLYLTQTANHANFVQPRFYLEDKGAIIPYSIDRTAHLCSCCVELFQILGTSFQKKLVAPCPGAAIFARLKPDQYLLVEASPSS